MNETGTCLYHIYGGKGVCEAKKERRRGYLHKAMGGLRSKKRIKDVSRGPQGKNAKRRTECYIGKKSGGGGIRVLHKTGALKSLEKEEHLTSYLGLRKR